MNEKINNNMTENTAVTLTGDDAQKVNNATKIIGGSLLGVCAGVGLGFCASEMSNAEWVQDLLNGNNNDGIIELDPSSVAESTITNTSNLLTSTTMESINDQLLASAGFKIHDGAIEIIADNFTSVADSVEKLKDFGINLSDEDEKLLNLLNDNGWTIPEEGGIKGTFEWGKSLFTDTPREDLSDLIERLDNGHAVAGFAVVGDSTNNTFNSIAANDEMARMQDLGDLKDSYITKVETNPDFLERSSLQEGGKFNFASDTAESLIPGNSGNYLIMPKNPDSDWFNNARNSLDKMSINYKAQVTLLNKLEKIYSPVFEKANDAISSLNTKEYLVGGGAVGGLLGGALNATTSNKQTQRNFVTRYANNTRNKIDPQSIRNQQILAHYNAINQV